MHIKISNGIYFYNGFKLHELNIKTQEILHTAV